MMSPTTIRRRPRGLLLGLTLSLPAGVLAQPPEPPHLAAPATLSQSPPRSSAIAPSDLPAPAHLESVPIANRLVDAVDRAVVPLKERLLELLRDVTSLDGATRSHHRRRGHDRPNPWRLVMPSPFDFLEHDSEGPRPVYLIDVVEEAIQAHMRTLGEIAWEYERQGVFAYGAWLRRADPGMDGSGNIEVGPIGALHDIKINFRARIQHPGGTAPAVLVRFMFAPESDGEPVVARLIIPSAGVSPSFTREIGPDHARDGQPTERDYGMVPRLVTARTILEVRGESGWVRPPNDWQEHYRAPAPRPMRRAPLFDPPPGRGPLEPRPLHPLEP